MIVAWTLMAALIVLSVFYVMHYLVNKNNAGHDETLTSFVSARRLEVKEDQGAGRLTEEEAQQLLQDVTSESHYVNQHQQRALTKDTQLARWVLSVMIAGVIIGSVALYQKLGFAPDVKITQQLIEQSATQDDVTEFLSYRVQRYDRAEDWYYLANDQVMAQNFEQAISSYREVLARLDGSSEDAINVQVELAQALFYSQSNQVSPAMTTAVDEALAQQPDNAKALGLKGIIEFDAGRYQEAILAWQEAIVNGTDRAERLDLLSGIAAARKQGGITEQMIPSIVTHRLHLQLDLDVRKISANDVFLVYAQVPDQRMPVAIQRIPAAQIQAPIVLTNLDNLMPGQSLADVARVDVVVKRSTNDANDLTLGEVVGYLSSVPSNSDKIFKVNVGL